MAWSTVPLGSALTFQRGFDITKDVQCEGPYSVISSSGPTSTHSEFKVRGPGVIIGRKGSLGTVFFSREDFWPHDTTLWVKDFHGNSPRFAYYFLQAMHFERLDVGASNPTLNRNHIHVIPVLWPSLPEQKRIAGILSAYDDLIENCERRIKVLDEMARALYREWFVEFRYPGHAKVPFVNSEFGKVPRDWVPVALNDVCERITDGAHASPASVPEGMPMASSKDMYDWGLDLSTTRKISHADFSTLVRNGCRPLTGDVLIIKDGANYLKHIFVHRDEMDVVLLSSVAILRANARVTPSLLAATLKSPETRGRLKNCVTGAAIPRIVLKDFKAFRFLLPSREVQDAWTKFGEPMEVSCWKLSVLIGRLRAARDLLLPRLLSGQLTVSEAA